MKVRKKMKAREKGGHVRPVKNEGTYKAKIRRHVGT